MLTVGAGEMAFFFSDLNEHVMQVARTNSFVDCNGPLVSSPALQPSIRSEALLKVLRNPQEPWEGAREENW